MLTTKKNLQFFPHSLKKILVLSALFFFSWHLSSLADLNARGVILKAFTQFKLKSCIDFKPRDSESYYLKFEKLDG